MAFAVYYKEYKSLSEAQFGSVLQKAKSFEAVHWWLTK